MNYTFEILVVDRPRVLRGNGSCIYGSHEGRFVAPATAARNTAGAELAKFLRESKPQFLAENEPEIMNRFLPNQPSAENGDALTFTVLEVIIDVRWSKQEAK